MLSNLKIDDIEVRILYRGGTVAWSAMVNGREIGELLTNQEDGALAERIAKAVFEERQKADDVER